MVISNKKTIFAKEKVFAKITRMNNLIIPFPQFRPEPNDIMYHYCSAESFKAIIENKTLRFCDLYHMNDKTELMHGYFLFKTMLKESDMSAEQQQLTDEVGRQSFIKNNKIQTPTVSVSSSLQNSWKSIKLK